MRLNTFVSVAVLLVFVTFASPPASAECDTAGPTLLAVTLDETAVDVTNAPRSITCSMDLDDFPAGVSRADCVLAPMSDSPSQLCTATAPSSGTPHSGTWSCTITIPRYADQGEWKVAVVAQDTVTNEAIYEWYQLPPGSQSSVIVTSNPDLVAPAVGTVTLSPAAINVSGSSQSVTCTMPVTDAKSGVAQARCTIFAPADSSEQFADCSATSPSSGTRNNGTFQCAVEVKRYSDAGTWTTSVILEDQVGNFLDTDVPATLGVTANPEDIVRPTVEFDFNPKIVDTGSGPAAVTCTFDVQDQLAGVDFAVCHFVYFDFDRSQSEACIAVLPSSGTRNEGRFTCTVPIPAYSASGVWTAEWSAVSDMAGNTQWLSSVSQVLQVECGEGDSQTSIRFSDSTTLTWTAIAGATRYSVYRGFATGLSDDDADGLPDGGYGICQNSRDPNPQDTQFVDTDVPTASQRGFHYLVGYTTEGVEQGLGSTSDGTPREVDVPCP